MDNNALQTPEPGPPKKGFFGFIAKLFPKQPAPPSHVDPTSSPAQSPSEQSSAPEASTTSADQPSAPAEPSIQPVESQTPESAPVAPPVTSEPDLLNRPTPTIAPDHDPQPLAVPDTLNAEPIEADGTKVSPTLPTQPPASGTPASETQQPFPPTDPNRPVQPPQQQ